MEGVLGILGFSLGASVGISAARTLAGGLRPALRGVLKAGLVAGDTARSAVAPIGRTVGGAMAEARENLGDLRVESSWASRRPLPKRRGTHPAPALHFARVGHRQAGCRPMMEPAPLTARRCYRQAETPLG
jgi:hypothetical protein